MKLKCELLRMPSTLERTRRDWNTSSAAWASTKRARVQWSTASGWLGGGGSSNPPHPLAPPQAALGLRNSQSHGVGVRYYLRLWNISKGINIEDTSQTCCRRGAVFHFFYMD